MHSPSLYHISIHTAVRARRQYAYIPCGDQRSTVYGSGRQICCITLALPASVCKSIQCMSNLKRDTALSLKCGTHTASCHSREHQAVGNDKEASASATSFPVNTICAHPSARSLHRPRKPDPRFRAAHSAGLRLSALRFAFNPKSPSPRLTPCAAAWRRSHRLPSARCAAAGAQAAPPPRAAAPPPADSTPAA